MLGRTRMQNKSDESTISLELNFATDVLANATPNAFRSINTFVRDAVAVQGMWKGPVIKACLEVNQPLLPGREQNCRAVERGTHFKFVGPTEHPKPSGFTGWPYSWVRAKFSRTGRPDLHSKKRIIVYEYSFTSLFWNHRSICHAVSWQGVLRKFRNRDDSGRRAGN